MLDQGLDVDVALGHGSEMEFVGLPLHQAEIGLTQDDIPGIGARLGEGDTAHLVLGVQGPPAVHHPSVPWKPPLVSNSPTGPADAEEVVEPDAPALGREQPCKPMTQDMASVRALSRDVFIVTPLITDGNNGVDFRTHAENDRVILRPAFHCQDSHTILEWKSIS